MLNDLEVTTEDKGIIIHYSFEVSKNSPPVRDITWSKNAQPMYIKDDKFSGGSLHDIRLVIISPSEDDKGNYSCTVTNDVGSETKYIILGKFVLILVVLYNYYIILFLCSPLPFVADICIVIFFFRIKKSITFDYQSVKRLSNISNLKHYLDIFLCFIYTLKLIYRVTNKGHLIFVRHRYGFFFIIANVCDKHMYSLKFQLYY